jgi:ABC-type transporter Mla MlaB component
MKTKPDPKIALDPQIKNIISDAPEIMAEIEKKITSNVKFINLSGDQYVVTDELPGVYCEGVQYYDLKNVGFISNTGMANLVELLKSLLEKGVEVQFVNVNDKIKKKIKSLGLEHILNCC